MVHDEVSSVFGRPGSAGAHSAGGPGAAHGSQSRDVAGRGARTHDGRSADMTAIAPHPIISRPSPAHIARKGSRLSSLLRTTDHKTIGLMYLTASFVFFIIGGLMAMLMRAELGRPG